MWIFFASVFLLELKTVQIFKMGEVFVPYGGTQCRFIFFVANLGV